MGGEDKLAVPMEGSSSFPNKLNLSDLKKQRGSLKGRLTQFKKFVDSVQHSSPSALQIKEVKFRMQAAKDHYQNFNNIESQIELISPEQDILSNLEYVETFESLYFTTLAIAESIVECGETDDSLNNIKNNVFSSRVNTKLPDIKLPTFDGTPDNWLEYKNSYTTMIHQRSDLDAIQKFHYLRSSLSGSALQVINALEFTAENYLYAWELLDNRFHNTRLLVNNHLKALFNIPPLKQESHMQIRKVIDTVLRNLRALKSLDEPTDSWDTVIIYLIVTKLDISTERDWENHKGSLLKDDRCRKLQLNDLLSFLRHKADMLDMLDRITSSLPTTDIDPDIIRIPKDILLADPAYNTSSEIDLLIGANLFWDILDGEKIRLMSGPYLQRSKLGWLLSGPLYTKGLNKMQVQCNLNQTLDDQLKRFWEIENVSPSHDVLTADERMCEELFNNTTIREPDGRFSVRIPLKASPTKLGDSYNLAKNRFLALERKLERSTEYKRMYREFMNEYEALGHMSPIHKIEEPNYFLPHHGVLKENSTTTKLRVVFNASAPTSSQTSLNDIQLPGPALQNDIFSILLRFRQYKYVACADIEKMFRQVLIQSDQRSLQLILWRDNSVDPLRVYQLNTVTYGTASAPYLSMRCIRQLAKECNDDVISRVINEDIFVDDLITGSDDYQQLLSLCGGVSKVLQSGCFTLRKWTFNSDVTNNPSAHMFVGEHTQNKTLGIGWHSNTDELYYGTKVDEYNNVTILTKRVMLSIISQIYDPLGLLSPLIIISKILLQQLWLSKLDWDTPVSDDVRVAWYNFLKTIKYINDLKIPRHVLSESVQYLELHIFTDASQHAYGACAYIRTYSDDSEITVKLLCAKSKVAPLKSITIPRLELCGALVGARLYNKIVNSLRLTFSGVYFWTDSTIVIGWLNMLPHLLKTFVQNRVTEINELTGDSNWRHVASKDNPADLLSRGLVVQSLVECNLWWNGPSYLNSNNFSNDTNNNLINFDNLPELKSQNIHNFVCVSPVEFIQFSKYSSFSKLIRVYAYVLRFISNVRCKRNQSTQQTGSLTVCELNASQQTLVRLAQRQCFPHVYELLINNLPLKTNSKGLNAIAGLNVFLDDKKLIRVGGRLANSTSFDYNKKHPILLCSKHNLSSLLVRHEHKRLLHAGPQQLLSTIRETWWLLRARNLIRKIVRECVICSRIRGQTLSPIMGNLPAARLEPGYPFIRTGVDYAGPVMVLNRKGRGARLMKSYICLFVCFITRAVHLELVTGLSTEDYILALKRFMSRRGKPNVIYSDNGKNFVGAERELSFLFQNNSLEITGFAADNGIQFHFIPPYSPHFGGLWEGGVRSCKHHLKRIVGNANLTYEELSTVLTQIEAVLNSRPMSPLSTDPSDYTPLTPGHFLIGRPLTSPPSENVADETTSRLSRYKRIEQMRQQFWKRWSKEYVSELQQRTKWKSHQSDIALGSLVLIKDDNLPPLKWKLGRVMRVFPGTDGVSRVADIRTTAGIIRRAFSKICPLPMPADDIKPT